LRAASARSSAVSPTVASAGFGTGFVNNERTPQKILAVQARNGFFRCDIISDFYKGETTRLAGIAIADNRDRIDADSEVGEFRSDIFCRGAEWKVPYIEFLHRRFSYRLSWRFLVHWTIRLTGHVGTGNPLLDCRTGPFARYPKDT
jgi:hypothetical protein